MPGAASYALNITSVASASKADHGRNRVRADRAPSRPAVHLERDGATTRPGNPLGTSATRAFKIDATAPTVTKVTPATLKPTSTIKVKFSEKVQGRLREVRSSCSG